MIGRVRVSPSPLEYLELERPPSKIFKDDSLSIYETTLMKLKQGSQRSLLPQERPNTELDSTSSGHDLSSASPNSVIFDSNSSASNDSLEISTSHRDEGTPTLSSCSTTDVSSSPNSKSQNGRDISILYLFSKYKNTHHESLPYKEEPMIIDNPSSTNTANVTSDCESICNTNHHHI